MYFVILKKGSGILSVHDKASFDRKINKAIACFFTKEARIGSLLGNKPIILQVLSYNILGISTHPQLHTCVIIRMSYSSWDITIHNIPYTWKFLRYIIFADD